MELKSALKVAWLYRNIIIVFLAPIILLPLPLTMDIKEVRCAYAILLMAIYWITEALPIPVTALLPIILFPMLQVIPAKQISKYYVNDTTMLFIGGLLLAIAIETWQLHKRIALRLLMLFGTEPRWLLLGLMLNTWFLSMWISNTATAAMMMPIAEAVLQQLKNTREQDIQGNDNMAVEMGSIGDKSLQLNNPSADTQDNGNPPSNNESKKYARRNVRSTTFMSTKKSANGATENKISYTAISNKSGIKCLKLNDDDDKNSEIHFSRLCKVITLSIAYAANTGGIGTLTGTAPNLVLKAQAEQVFARFYLEAPVTFATWMMFGVPLSFINLLLTWIWLQIFFLRCNGLTSCCKRNQTSNMKQNIHKVIKREYELLGTMSFAEIMVLVCFVALAFLWITRDLQTAGGWGRLFGEKFVSDSTPAILIGILLFIIPSEIPRLKPEENTGENQSKKPATLLTWPIVHEKLPWGIVLLLGGGFALASASKVSGLSIIISQKLIVLSSMTPWVMNMVLSFIVAAATEVTSNTATATLLMPIMAELALSLNLNPLYLMFPAALACSFAFMLPVATPPNAIVFAGGHLKVSDMASAGLFVNIICVLIMTLAVNTWGDLIFDFHNVPQAFMNTTTTPTFNTTS